MSEINARPQQEGKETERKNKHQHKFLPTFSSKGIDVCTLPDDFATTDLESISTQSSSLGFADPSLKSTRIGLQTLVGVLATAGLAAYITAFVVLDALKFGAYLIPVLVFMMPVVVVAVWSGLAVFRHLAGCLTAKKGRQKAMELPKDRV
ncbi:hypothetical protein BSKO_02342 [Bryopsis sp. KO-2023]|nr:hypothetical protein BSKO_02342 [Bryopsis sp. KO-2023]